MNSKRSVTRDEELASPALLKAHAHRSEFTWRAFFLGLLLVVGLAAITPYNDYVRGGTYLVGNQLPITVITTLAVLSLVVNPILGKRRFRLAEMAIAISMMLVSCGVPSSGLLRFFHSLLTGVVYQGSPQPGMHPLIEALPSWIVPSKDPASSIIYQLRMGIDPQRGETLGATFGPWVQTYLAWGWFIVSIFMAMILLCVLFRRQWVQRERLAFPLAMIPLELMAPPEEGRRVNALWRSRALWIGASIPLAVHLLNGSHSFWPSVPHIPLVYDLSASFTESPWNLLSKSVTHPQVYFSVIAAVYFVPLEITFSTWFVFFAYELGKMWLLASDVPVTNEHRGYQGLGATVAYGVLLLWIAKGHLAHVARSAWRGLPREPEEFLSYRTIVVGLAAAFISASAFLAVAGMRWWAGVLLVGFILFFCMILTRIVIDAGMLFVLLPEGADPMVMFHVLFKGGTLLKAKDWILTSVTQRMIMADQRENIMPFTADAMRIASEAGTKSRVKVFGSFITAMLVALVVGGLSHHVIHYTQGMSKVDGWTTYNSPRKTLDEARAGEDPVDTGGSQVNRLAQFELGAAAMAVVGVGRSLFSGFPLHPIGLLLFSSGAVYVAWFSIVIGWAIKFILVRWGGAKMYREARAFFIGLVVGDSLAGIFWVIVGLMVQWPTGSYQVLPG